MRTATREVFEETGVQAEISGFLGMWLDDYRDRSGGSKRTLNIYYHAVPTRSARTFADADQAEVVEPGFFQRQSCRRTWRFPATCPQCFGPGSGH
jgi:8-oxo-dGTP pyrophosphatase MutT (NUDIX family)